MAYQKVDTPISFHSMIDILSANMMVVAYTFHHDPEVQLSHGILCHLLVLMVPG